jgi:hypothetical protein
MTLAPAPVGCSAPAQAPDHSRSLAMHIRDKASTHGVNHAAMLLLIAACAQASLQVKRHRSCEGPLPCELARHSTAHLASPLPQALLKCHCATCHTYRCGPCSLMQHPPGSGTAPNAFAPPPPPPPPPGAAQAHLEQSIPEQSHIQAWWQQLRPASCCHACTCC